MSRKTLSVANDDRREEVANATWRVIARDGLDKASLRAIAHELGCTTGVLTHYFRDKEALLDFAFAGIVERINRERDPRAEANPSLDDVLHWLTDFLPTTTEARASWRVWLSFTLAALASSRQSANHSAFYTELRAFWTGIIEKLKATGAFSAKLDARLEAETLLCLLDGVCIQALITPRVLPARRQIEILENHLSRLVR